MDYAVEKVSDTLRIEPAGGQGERQRKRENPQQKGSRRDSVSISEEARKRSIAEGGDGSSSA